MDPMKEALNRRIGKGLQITILAQPGAEVEIGGENQEHDAEESEKGSDLAPAAKDEQSLEQGEMSAMDGGGAQVDPLDGAQAVNKPRGSLFQRAEMAQAQKQMKKGK